jgi:hypothetical protein
VIVPAHIGADHLLVTGSVLGASVLILNGRSLRRLSTSLLLSVALAAFAFQLVHTAEHLAQLGNWVRSPSSIPWLSPWAGLGRNVLAGVVWGQRGTGNELLHLVGNGIFLVGALAALLAVRWLGTGRATWLRRIVWVQGLHVAEHALLVATLLLTGRAEGLSTLFGLVDPPSTLAFSLRVLLHFTWNMAGTLMLAAAYGEVASAVASRWRRAAWPNAA